MKTGKEYWDLHHDNTVEFFKTRPQWIGNYDNDYPSAVFIRGLIAEYKPQNILEIGTAAGWAAYYMMEEALKHNLLAKVTSVDFIDSLYYLPEKPVGAAFKETAPVLYKNWNLKTNLTAIDFAKNCNEKYDFVFIDANHYHPWAALDFLAVLPLLKDNAVVVFHDVYLNEICLGKKRADRHPENLPIGEELFKGPNVIYKIFFDEMTLSYDDIAPNCAAMIVKNKQTVFKKIVKALQKPWEYKYINKQFLQQTLSHYIPYIAKHFGCLAVQKLSFICNLQFIAFNIYTIKHNSAIFIKDWKKVTKLKKEIKNKKAVLWGASIYLEKLIKNSNLNSAEIIGIVDINAGKTGKKLGKYEIFTPDALKALKPDIIIPTTINHPQVVSYIEKHLTENSLRSEISTILLS